MKKTEFECFMEGMEILERYATGNTYVWGRADNCRIDNVNKLYEEDLETLCNIEGFWHNEENSTEFQDSFYFC